MLEVGNIHSGSKGIPVSRSQVASVVSRSAPAPSVKAPTYTSSSIRVDNLQDVAILEYRSETGEVKEQYPTQKQIAAFKTAQRLEAQKQEAASRARVAEHNTAPTSEHNTAATSEHNTTVSVPSTPAPSSEGSEAPAPALTGGSGDSILV